MHRHIEPKTPYGYECRNYNDGDNGGGGGGGGDDDDDDWRNIITP